MSATAKRPLRPSPRAVRRLRARRATILILTLWLTVVLVLLAQSLAYEMRVEMMLTGAHRDYFQSEQLARIGVARAVADLRNDRLIDGADELQADRQFDALGDVWTGGSLNPYRLEIDSAAGTGNAVGHVDVMVVDEESKFPLNGTGTQWRLVMKYLLMMLDLEEEEAQEMADTIGDWSDPDDIIMDPESTNETVFYTALMEEKGGAPRNADGSIQKVLPKNGPFETVDELLQIPGMTPELFYGYDPEEGQEPRFFPIRSIGQRLDERIGLRDVLTVRTRDINLNTVSFEVLSAICAAALEDLDAGRAAARRLIDHRQGRSVNNIDNNTAFRSIEELGQVDGLSGPLNSLIRGSARDVNLTVQSNLFTIYSRAQSGREERRIYTSRTTDEPRGRALPEASIVAECQRDVLLLEGQDFEDMLFPGYSPQIPSGAAAQLGFAQWYIPVVYFKSWNSF